MPQTRLPQSRFLFALILVLLATSVSQATEFIELKDVRHVTDQFFAAGQPSKEVLTSLSNEGVKHVINLRPTSETPDFDEATIAAELKMEYHNLPIKDAKDLTMENVKAFDALISKAGTDKTLLHCSSGNRVGALMALRAAWLQGASTEQGLVEGKQYGLTRMQEAVENLLQKK